MLGAVFAMLLVMLAIHPTTAALDPMPDPPAGALSQFGVSWSFASADPLNTPILVDDVLYAWDRNSLYALNVEDGSESWRFERGSEDPRPAVVDGVVYVGDKRYLYALDAREGSQLWRVKAERPSLPAVDDDSVYFLDDGTVRALDRRDGSERWRFQAEESLYSPVVDAGRVYVRGDQGRLYALDAADGSVAWRFDTHDAAAPGVEVVDDTVYVRNGDVLHAVNRTDGSRSWTRAGQAGNMQHDGGTLFLPRDGLRAVVADDGATRWHAGIRFDDARVVNGVVYAFDVSNLYAFDARNGTELWALHPGFGNLDPVISDGVVYRASWAFNDGTNRLFAYDAESGALLWQTAFGTHFGTPLVTPERIVVPAACTLFALDPSSEGEGSFDGSSSCRSYIPFAPAPLVVVSIAAAAWWTRRKRRSGPEGAMGGRSTRVPASTI